MSVCKQPQVSRRTGRVRIFSTGAGGGGAAGAPHACPTVHALYLLCVTFFGLYTTISTAKMPFPSSLLSPEASGSSVKHLRRANPRANTHTRTHILVLCPKAHCAQGCCDTQLWETPQSPLCHFGHLLNTVPRLPHL